MKNRLKLMPLVALFASASAPAAELVYEATSPGYTVVVVDSRKLKTPVAQALAAWPGPECTTASDLNSPIVCPGLTIRGINSYNVNLFGFQAPQVTTTDSKGRVRTSSARVDGINQKYFVNARIRTGLIQSVLCPDGLTAIAQPDPPPQVMEFVPATPLSEFGLEIGLQPEAILTDIDVEVNGQWVGTYFPTPGLVQYVGVRAAEGEAITSVRFLPHDLMRGQTYGCNDSLTHEYGYVFADKLFYR